MPTATKKAAAKKVPPAPKKAAAKKAAARKAAPEQESPKPRGRQRDLEREAKLTSILLKHVTVEGEWPNVRFKGIGAAAEAADIDQIRAASLLYRHLAQENGVQTPSPDAVSKARLSGLGWGVIDAMFGISRAESHRLFDEKHGEGAHSKMRLYGQGGAERIKPAAEPKPKSERASGKASSKEVSPRFSGDEPAADIVGALDGKTCQVRVRASGVEAVQKVKLAKGTVKVGKAKDKRVVRFTDGKGNTRTLPLEAFVK